MDLIVNGEIIHSVAGVNLQIFLQGMNLPDSGIAVAVNEEIIARKEWASRILSPKDNILIITATQGG